jgi:uncharacterized protein (DUF1015 family)
MSHLIRPFAALRPRPDRAQAVIAPPYDVVDTDEARALAADRPESFLHISRPEIDLPADTDPHSDAVYARGASNLRGLIERGTLERETAECYYVYRMVAEDHTQTGIACVASIEAYEANRIHRHELTRPDKENDRVRNVEALDAQTGPVMLTYKANPDVDALLESAAAAPPLLEAVGQHDVAHIVWRIDDESVIESLTDAVDALGDLYIADGHHRSAAAARVAAKRRLPGARRNASHDYFLSVAFPDDEVQIFDYNRVVADLNGLSRREFVNAVEHAFVVEPAHGRAKPDTAGTFGMYVDGRWYRLKPRSAPEGEDPVARLDISQLQQKLLAPILGIGDPRIDERIAFVGGVRGLESLELRVDSGNAAVAFALYPTSIRDLMAVADAGLLMPPKSTWFEPKLADGLLSHVLEPAGPG